MNGYEILEQVDLKKYNTYGVGGNAKYLIKPKSVEKLRDLIKYLKDNKIKWYILGGGSNVILPDEDYSGVIIKLDLIDEFFVDNDIITVGAGLNLNKFVKKMLDMGYTNYATLYGIPGSLGGAIIGNAGSFGKSLYDDLISVTVMDNEGAIKKIKKEEISYSYRNTEFKNSDKIILGASFKGIKGSTDDAWKIIQNNMDKRKNTQPLEYKNAGSVFKNPENYAAGYLIEQVGLKGFKVNDAMVSMKHANFIVNLGNASGSDIIKLIEIIKEKIKEEKNIELDLEQIIVKW